MSYCVIRTDLMSAVNNAADLVSLRFYNAEGEMAEIENGVIVELQGFEEDQREVRKAVAATSSSDLNSCAIVAGVEVMYDERKVNLDEYINEKGKAVRGYVPRSRNMFSLTKEGFVGGTVPEVGAEVGIGEGGKLNSAGTGFSKSVASDVAGRYTYYTIEIGKTEN